MNDLDSRKQLVSRLNNPTYFVHGIFDPTEVVSSSLPSHVKGVVLEDKGTVQVDHRWVQVLRVTILTGMMDIHESFRSCLFQLEAVTQYVTRGSRTVVVNNLREADAAHMMSQGNGFSQHQLLTQGSQDIGTFTVPQGRMGVDENSLATMGFGVLDENSRGSWA